MFTFFIAILVIGIIVLVHELGHFLIAKAFGITVERFSIGFPPTMLSKKIGETEYCIGWIPFGGYVKLLGEAPDSEIQNPRSFRAKPPIIRIAVLAAGPFMNIILGFILMFCVLMGYGEGIPRFESAEIGSIISGMPASEAGIAAGDVILTIDSDTVATWEDLTKIIHRNPNNPLILTISRGDSIFQIALTTSERIQQSDTGTITVGVIGITPSIEQRKLPFGEALTRSFEVTYAFSFAIVSFIGGLIIGQASMSEVGGPVMIAQMAGQSARLGIWQLIIFIGALSLNLAVLNLLPLPILDGGQILFTLFEAIRKKAISQKVQAAIQQLSIAFILAFMLIVTIKDILRLF